MAATVLWSFLTLTVSKGWLSADAPCSCTVVSILPETKCPKLCSSGNHEDFVLCLKFRLWSLVLSASLSFLNSLVLNSALEIWPFYCTKCKHLQQSTQVLCGFTSTSAAYSKLSFPNLWSFWTSLSLRNKLDLKMQQSKWIPEWQHCFLSWDSVSSYHWIWWGFHSLYNTVSQIPRSVS